MVLSSTPPSPSAVTAEPPHCLPKHLSSPFQGVDVPDAQQKATCWRVRDADHADTLTLTTSWWHSYSWWSIQGSWSSVWVEPSMQLSHRSASFVSKTYPKQGEVVHMFFLPPLLMFRQMIKVCWNVFLIKPIPIKLPEPLIHINIILG